MKTGQVNPDRPLVGPSVDTFVGCFVGAFVGSPRIKGWKQGNQPSWVLSWALSWGHSWTLMGPLVGQASLLPALRVAPIMGELGARQLSGPPNSEGRNSTTNFAKKLKFAAFCISDLEMQGPTCSKSPGTHSEGLWA